MLQYSVYACILYMLVFVLDLLTNNDNLAMERVFLPIRLTFVNFLNINFHIRYRDFRWIED